MTENNMKLWESVEKTDPKFVKAITGKSYNGSSPSPYYLVRKATETFGPCGIGWGFSIEDERLLDGAILEGGTIEKISHARVKVWYIWGGQPGSVEHVGQTVFCGRRNNGKLFTDEDAPKKSVTDALTKALSMIGFAGDIFSGRWDDSRYVSDLKTEFAEAPPEIKPETVVKIALDPEQWAKDVALAKSFTDTHDWPESFAWWGANLPMLERIKERDPLVYAEIYKKFMDKKKAHAQ